MNPSENTSCITFFKRCILRPSLFNVVFVTLVLSVAFVVVPLILSIALFVSDKMESAGMKYATLVSAVAGERVGPFFRYPQQVLQYSQRAIASPMRSSSVGSGWFDPNGTLDNAAFWVGKFVRPDAGLLYSIYDNASLNSTFVYNQNLHAAADSTIPNNVIVERIGPPNITTGMNFGIDTIRSFDDLSHIVSNDNFSTVFDFRGRPAFYSTVAIPFTSPDSQIPKWFPPSLSFYKNSITMSIALPYYNASPPPTSTNSSSSDMPIGVQTVILFVNVVTKFMQTLSYGHTSLLQGSFALFEVSTRAFIGGNFNDGGLRFVNQTTNTTLSNGTVIFSAQNISRMASICEASDSLLQLACAEIGEDAIASCSPAPCSLMFRGNPPKGRFSSALMKSHSLLYVTEVRDDNINLNLRLVAVTDLNDVMDRVRDGLVAAVIASVVFAAVLIIVASVAAYRSLAPLHKVEEKMLEASRTVRECDAGAEQPSAMAIIEALSVIDSNTATESMFSEVDQVLLAFEVLAADLRGICAFLPRAASSQDDPSFGSPNNSYTADDSPLPSVATSVDAKNLLQGSRLPALGIKNVTVAFLNFPRTHTVIDMRKAAARLDQIAAVVLDCAGKSRGVVESFFGDQFMVSFNASRKSSTHPLQAAYFLECLHDELSSVDDDTLAGHATNAPYVPMVYAGVCTGPALVRQLEAPSLLLRTQIVGHVISQASSLMRLAKSRETSVLLSDTMIAALHGVQFHSPAVEQDALRSVRTMIPRVYVHHTALVRVAFRSAPMLTASLFRAPPTGDKPSSISMTIKQAAHVGLHARIREAIPTMIDPQTRCDPLLCKSVRCSPPVVTIQGIAAANNAMSVYQSGNTAEARFLAQKCNEEHPPLLTRFFFMTGVLKSV